MASDGTSGERVARDAELRQLIFGALRRYAGEQGRIHASSFVDVIEGLGLKLGLRALDDILLDCHLEDGWVDLTNFAHSIQSGKQLHQSQRTVATTTHRSQLQRLFDDYSRGSIDTDGLCRGIESLGLQLTPRLQMALTRARGSNDLSFATFYMGLVDTNAGVSRSVSLGKHEACGDAAFRYHRYENESPEPARQKPSLREEFQGAASCIPSSLFDAEALVRRRRTHAAVRKLAAGDMTAQRFKEVLKAEPPAQVQKLLAEHAACGDIKLAKFSLFDARSVDKYTHGDVAAATRSLLRSLNKPYGLRELHYQLFRTATAPDFSHFSRILPGSIADHELRTLFLALEDDFMPKRVCQNKFRKVLTANTFSSSRRKLVASVFESLQSGDAPVSVDELRRAYARCDFDALRLPDQSKLADFLDAYAAISTLVEDDQHFENLVSTSWRNGTKGDPHGETARALAKESHGDLVAWTTGPSLLERRDTKKRHSSIRAYGAVEKNSFQYTDWGTASQAHANSELDRFFGVKRSSPLSFVHTNGESGLLGWRAPRDKDDKAHLALPKQRNSHTNEAPTTPPRHPLELAGGKRNYAQRNVHPICPYGLECEPSMPTTRTEKTHVRLPIALRHVL